MLFELDGILPDTNLLDRAATLHLKMCFAAGRNTEVIGAGSLVIATHDDRIAQVPSSLGLPLKVAWLTRR